MERDGVISEGNSGPFILLTGVELCLPLRVVNDIPVQKTQKGGFKNSNLKKSIRTTYVVKRTKYILRVKSRKKHI